MITGLYDVTVWNFRFISDILMLFINFEADPWTLKIDRKCHRNVDDLLGQLKAVVLQVEINR